MKNPKTTLIEVIAIIALVINALAITLGFIGEGLKLFQSNGNEETAVCECCCEKGEMPNA